MNVLVIMCCSRQNDPLFTNLVDWVVLEVSTRVLLGYYSGTTRVLQGTTRVLLGYCSARKSSDTMFRSVTRCVSNVRGSPLDGS